MNTIYTISQTCRCCGKMFEVPSYYLIVPNYCDKCIVKLIKEGVVKPHVGRRETVEKQNTIF